MFVNIQTFIFMNISLLSPHLQYSIKLKTLHDPRIWIRLLAGISGHVRMVGAKDRRHYMWNVSSRWPRVFHVIWDNKATYVFSLSGTGITLIKMDIGKYIDTWEFTIPMWASQALFLNNLFHTAATSCSPRLAVILACYEIFVVFLVPLIASVLNTLKPRQNGRHFADDTFNRIFVNENVRIPMKISLKFVAKGIINNLPALVQIMAWRRPGDSLYCCLYS